MWPDIVSSDGQTGSGPGYGLGEEDSGLLWGMLQANLPIQAWLKPWEVLFLYR